MRFRVFSCFVVAFVFLCSFTSAGQTRHVNFNQLDAMARTCIKLIQNSDFRGAAMLYHYPADYSEAELQADIGGVEKSLQVFASEFGAFNEVTPLDERKLYVNIFASAGSHAYWEQHTDVYKVEMETNFSNFGSGYLIIHFVDIVGVPEVKAVAYGLPVSGESVARIRQVGERMIPLIKARQSGLNKDKL